MDKKAEKNLRIGGVMRCCAGTLRDAKNLKETEGAILPCKYCKSSLIFRGNAWEWNQPSVN